ncbi:HD domain-containing protein [Clostridium folliculivorans]|uniref:HD family phosphohydrolase n=1 Tax=Clostridium folliculivorans TaxID=2886038 RepID=A0A9W6D9D9_9CLOT|nr:HD domain-containing protein [Clostridium folliculivorans]GKU23806.1 HD family phosphohydrolase [Clostridium folliculivorans]GKU29922.1 HD family phosphohydrolase [Clostridium folliculivorans]
MIISNITNIMIKYFDGDIKRINHALKVYSFAKIIGELEQVAKDELFIIEISAILHDIGIKISEQKYNSSNGKYQEIEGPPVAKELLSSFNLDASIVDRVCYLIGNHHSYDKIDSVDFQILVEADFLVNIYEDEIPKDNIAVIEEKIFKTCSGKKLLNSIYM